MILTKILSHFEVIQSMLNLSVCHKVFQHAKVLFYQLNCHTTNKHQFDVKIMSENILDSVEDDDESETIEGDNLFFNKIIGNLSLNFIFLSNFVFQDLVS